MKSTTHTWFPNRSYAYFCRFYNARPSGNQHNNSCRGQSLDVDSANKGILIPRIDISNLNAISPVTGGSTTSLLVYNTNSTTGPGYFTGMDHDGYALMGKTIGSLQAMQVPPLALIFRDHRRCGCRTCYQWLREYAFGERWAGYR